MSFNEAEKDDLKEKLKELATREELERKISTQISPEYKSSWNDTNIQGDYDQYARSTAPSRRLLNENSQSKTDSTVSPSSKEGEQVKDVPSPRTKRTRVKLTKPASQPVRSNPTPAVKEAKAVEKATLEEFKGMKVNESKTSHSGNIQPFEKIDNEKETFQLSERENSKVSESEKHSQFNHDGSVNSNKSSKEFTPPVVTAVDFHEPAMSQVVKYATRNGLLVEKSNQKNESYRTAQDGNVSRLSTMFMANYLGLGYEPASNVITSIVVKPLLPPLNLKKPVVRRRTVSKKSLSDDVEFQIAPEQKMIEENINDLTEKRKLAPLKDTHLYKWKHNEFVSNLRNSEYGRQMDAKKTPFRLQALDDDTESIFEHIVRWRSKVRHCGKPAMYRRITSPTLGEVALRRKLTDRLPTRQTRNNRLDVGDLQPRGSLETWRQPRSKFPADSSVKHFIKQKLKDAQKDGSLTSPNIIEGFYDVTMSMKQASLRKRIELHSRKNEVMKVPMPDLSLRKRQPVWQRMK